MSTSKNLSRSTADQAFKRVKPLLDRLRDDTKAAAAIVAKEYDALPKLEKAAFAEKVRAEYGWSQSRLARFAQIGRDFPHKKKLICRASARAKIDETSTNVMQQIVAMKDDDVKTAAKAGLFDPREDDSGNIKYTSGDDIVRFRKTGQLPASKPASKPTTDLGKIRAAMVVAKSHITKASLRIGEITAIMKDSNITDAKGREATALINAFEKLCTKMATANPETSKRAFAILKGEV